MTPLQWLEGERLNAVLLFGMWGVMAWLSPSEFSGMLVLAMTIWYVGVRIAAEIRDATERIVEKLKHDQEGAL